MAVTLTDAEPRPRWPRPGVIDPARCYVSYHPPADELVVSFGGTPVPKYVNPIEAPEADDLGIMVGMNDDESSTGEVVGLHVMPLLASAVRRHPAWATIAWGVLSGFDDDPVYLEALTDFLRGAEELFDRYWTPPPPIDEQLARLARADRPATP